MANEFMFIGEDKNNEDERFLVLGDDGRYYEYRPLRDSLEPVDPDGEEWEMSAPDTEEPGGGTPISPEDLDLD